MSDGSRLRQSWYNALNDAESHFRQLLTSTSHSDWRRISTTAESSGRKGKARVSTVPELTDVIVHRHIGKSGDDVYRMVLDVALGEEGAVSLEPWRAVLTTPELRQEWDPAVEEAHLLEMFDHKTRISKTNFTLGWPANPRDAVTISRLFHDANTVIDISTSLPRSADEPAYLRPSPPYVRSHIKLFAWCIQLVHPQSPQSNADDQTKKKLGRLRITCFWQHDLKALWGFNASSSSMAQQLSIMTLSLFKSVVKRGGRVAKLSGYGNGVSIVRIRYQMDREALNIEYAIIPEEDEHTTPNSQVEGMEEVHSLREQRRLTRSIECVLPSLEGWDVQVTTRASSEEVERLPWTAHALRTSSTSLSRDQIILRLTHTALPDAHSVLKVKVIIEVSGGTRGIRLNGIPKPIVEMEERDPSSHFMSQMILQDIASAADLSIDTGTSVGTMNSGASTSGSVNVITRTPTERSAAGDKSILSRIRRNYIYFSSLLQEPEAKWRRTTDARGVSITQLDSIDPTLVVYRAEAIFVGVNLWDLFAAVVSPGARIYWDKQHEDAVLLEDVNELTELWHYKTKPAWPVNGRDSVLLKTVYKSPNTIHVFSFSADEPHLFPNIPSSEPNIIRTQVDLQGWSIESLSPTTTLLTLLEQSDPKGWTNKTSIPTQMINTLAGIGEFAIKCGGPPIVTRLAGARANEVRYDHEKSSFRVEYEASASRRAATQGELDEDDSHSPGIELELRCDTDTWAASLDIIVDPPPQTISCLRRHRLSAEGGGLWLTLAHDALFVDDERLLVIVRKAPGKEKGLVMVNGAKIHVDVEEIPEHEIKALSKQKRVKPVRIPLDQPPVMSNIKKKRAEWDDNGDGSPTSPTGGNAAGTLKPPEGAASTWASAPKTSSPLARFFTYYVDQATATTQQAVAAITPASASGDHSVPSPSKSPLQYALEALSWVQDASAQTLSNDWTLVSDKGMLVHRKTVPEISPIIPVHRGSKVIEGLSAEELVPLITHWDCRRKWDDRFDSAKVFESYGADCETAFLVSRAGFPFRDRGFYLASVVVRGAVLGSSLSRQATSDGSGSSVGSSGGSRSIEGGGGDHSGSGARRAIYYVSASFSPDSVASFAPAKYNPHVLPIGRVYIDAWVLETLDPYSKENYMIPSTRCTRYIAVDYAGSIPAAVNSMINVTVPKCILSLETCVKGSAPLPVLRLPAPSLVVGALGRKEEEMFAGLKASAWKLKKRDESRVLVGERFGVEERVLRVCVLVSLPPHVAGKGRSASVSAVGAGATSKHGEAGSPESESQPQSPSQATTPRPSRMVLKSLSPGGRRQSSASFGGVPNDGIETMITLSSAEAGGGQLPSVTLTSPLSSPPPSSSSSVHQRQRTVSSNATLSPVAAAAAAAVTSVVEEQRRGRSTGAFTAKGEVRPPGDLVVAEVVVDKKMYPEGYEVRVVSKMRKEVKVGPRAGFVPLGGVAGSGAASLNGGNVLPLKYAIFVVPSSPMHSSGEAGRRHLVRVVLPTAQVERMGSGEVRDPLTGEVRGAAEEKPQWWNEMIECGGAVVWLEVVPATSAGSATAGSGNKGSVRRKSRKEDAGKGKEVIMVDGKEVGVVDEKEALTNLGREELMDDRVGRMNVISRVPNDSEALPDELKTPVGIADDLSDPGGSAGSVASGSGGKDGEEKKRAEMEAMTKEERETEGESPKGLGEKKDGGPHVGHALPSSGGLLGFFQGYPNPLTRFGVGMGMEEKGKGRAAGGSGGTRGEGPVAPAVPGGMMTEDMGGCETGGEMSVAGQVKRERYPMSTVVIVAVIAFLLGSLLRSLISPADFVYMGSKGGQGAGPGEGWREIRRLVEVKYVFGGWDLQIAVVRRH